MHSDLHGAGAHALRVTASILSIAPPSFGGRQLLPSALDKQHAAAAPSRSAVLPTSLRAVHYFR